MPIELPTLWLVAVNVLGWPAIQLAVAWLFMRLPAGSFDPQSWLCRPRMWEAGGRLYERVFAVKLWKRRLPDAAPWFRGGFAKKNLSAADPSYVSRFIGETCRGECAHWTMMLAAPLFFLWNPWWADLIMVAYAIAANLPCILVQRYNRLRLSRLGSGRSRPPM